MPPKKNPQTFAFLLGQNPELSTAEILRGRWADRAENFDFLTQSFPVFLGQNLKFEKTRNLPKSRTQNVLDCLGGTQQIAEFVDSFSDLNSLAKATFEHFPKTGKNIAFNFLGVQKNFLREFWNILNKKFDQKIRLENRHFAPASSGQIFERKVLKKGAAFLVLAAKNKFWLFQFTATQNLRNYDLRDFQKPFRDPKMGMLPVRLAQILVHLSGANRGEKVVDPFCGSGTIAGESALLGLESCNSDLDKKCVHGSRQNFEFLATKFRFDANLAGFEVADAQDLDFQKFQNFRVVSEGFLGTNFDTSEKINPEKIQIESEKILKIWQAVFANLRKNPPKKIVFCLPNWKCEHKKDVSILGRIEKIASVSGFKIEKNFLYSRSRTRVRRQIVVAAPKKI